MARPSSPSGFALTSSGVPFQWNLDNYRSKGARDAGVEQIEVIVAWNDVSRFLKDAVGYTTWDGKSKLLQRTLPLPHPLRDGYWCDQYDLSDFGAYESRSDFGISSTRYQVVPVQDWCVYTLEFVRPKWYVLTDKELAATSTDKEQGRYTWVTELPRPRERIISGYGFEYQKGDGSWKPVAEERQFIPDYQIDLVVNWVQVPIGAVPYSNILECMNKVNEKPIRFVTGGVEWPVGHLLFKGYAQPLEQYTGADDDLYYDISYKFTVQPGGWNTYPARTTTGGIEYRPVRVRRGPDSPYSPTDPNIPPYLSTDFQKLFQAPG